MNDDMARYYVANSDHYSTGLVRLGCSTKQAKVYSRYFDSFRERYYQVIFGLIEDKISHGKVALAVLDVGCGTGNDVLNLAARYPNVSFTGQELSETTCAICVEHAQQANRQNIHFTSAALSTISERYDLVISFCMLEHAADPVQIIQEMAALLKEDGVLVMVVPNHLYAWYWCFLKYAVYSLILRFASSLYVDPNHPKGIKTHSVKTPLIIKGISRAGLRVLKHENYGYRPPQVFYKYYPPRLLRWFNHMFAKADAIFHWLNWDPMLYLQITSAAQCSAPQPKLTSIRDSESKSNLLVSLFCAITGWVLYSWVDLFEILKKILKTRQDSNPSLTVDGT